MHRWLDSIDIFEAAVGAKEPACSLTPEPGPQVDHITGVEFEILNNKQHRNVEIIKAWKADTCWPIKKTTQHLLNAYYTPCTQLGFINRKI